ncbi:CLUMA_CG000389, isoform A [Clunio marinus]|uniref:CLUMA_CG000389, isoform A n=1 Tax=Clunio marinus TaxID=568069 RepID=A0A1J1HFF3_9DIPT|nr:CLUMA_CG000389, isoform A [Clunio marinus]
MAKNKVVRSMNLLQHSLSMLKHQSEEKLSSSRLKNRRIQNPSKAQFYAYTHALPFLFYLALSLKSRTAYAYNIVDPNV